MPASRAQRAKTAERRKNAIGLRLAGADWQQIADTLGYADRAAACKDVTRALEAHIAEQQTSAEVLLETELQRLDRLQRGLWPAAAAGDPKAADVVLRVSDRRMRYQRLDVAPDVEDRIRREMADRLGVQMFVAFGRVLEGLDLSDGQRQLVPVLLEQAVAGFVGGPRHIDGAMVGEAA